MSDTPFRNFTEFQESYCRIIRILADKVPAIRENCVLIGSGPAAALYLKHRTSWDIDLITTMLMGDIRPIVEQMKLKFGRHFNVYADSADQFCSGRLCLPAIPPIDLQLSQNVYDAIDVRSIKTRETGRMPVSSMEMYIDLKAQSAVERRKSADLIDLAACMNHPQYAKGVKQAIINSGRKGVARIHRGIQVELADLCRETTLEADIRGGYDQLRNFTADRLARYDLVARQRQLAQADGFGWF